MNLKKQGVMYEKIWGGERKGEMLPLYYNLKNKQSKT